MQRSLLFPWVKMMPVVRILPLIFCSIITYCGAQDILGCGGFIKSEVEINYSIIEVKLYTKQGSLKYQTDCAPNNGYYMVPVYDKGSYVLKVEPPPGWTFEPQSVDLIIDGKTDACSLGEDINFQFTGFGVVGKVVSRGESVGPEGVELTLKKTVNEEVVQRTTSTTGGDFVFEKVLPGDYVIDASRDPWLFDVPRAPVKVDRETGNAGSVITVSGYDVKGRVMSEGEPVQGVLFLLFTSKKSWFPRVTGCDSKPLTDVPLLADYTYLCHLVSAKDGTFTYASMPTGPYTLVPFYKGTHIKFDVVPNRLDVKVGHESILLPEVFQVAGFSVSGHVRTKIQGPGVAGARVIVDSKLQATTADDGVYHLDSMKSGTYQLKIEAPRMSFDVATVKVTPNTPQLPDIIVARFEACGIIEMEPIAVQSRSIRVTDDEGRLYKSAVAGLDGTFCVDCKPGKYHFSVELTEADIKVGLRLAPSSKEVTVVDAAVDGIRFVQYRARVSGTVHCLEASCGHLHVVLQSTSRSEDQRTAETDDAGQIATFSFNGVVPGKYRVSVLNDQWCWKAKYLDIEVVDKDIENIEFSQTGFMLSASLSHSIMLNFSLESNPNVVGSFNLTKGVNKFCLTQPGVYHLTPVSCHQFEQDVYSYDTSLPSVLSLVAVRHLVEGVVLTQQQQSDIKISIRSGDSTTEIGPLVDDVTVAESKLNATLATPQPLPSTFTYRFSYWAKNGEKIVFVAESGVVLFRPSSVEYTVLAGKCLGIVATFEGHLGVFIDGQIHPPLEGVTITISSGEGVKVRELLSDVNGKYRVGPLDSASQYSVTAEREGYQFSNMDNQPIGHFKSFKLGRIHVQVSDQSELPLAGALLSLSGSGNYRRNSVTQEGGVLEFTSLSPGDYYLRVMMKEYHFEPASQLISVAEGDTVELKIVGRRVEFSCYGLVTSLSGEAEASVHVEAVANINTNKELCRALQEETKTELDGSFRIRGLQPGCAYTIHLKAGEINSHIERSMPSSKLIQIVDGDVTGINIIAFRRVSQMDISGNIIGNSSMEHINTVKVYIYKVSSQDSPVHSTSLGPTSFFYLPSVPMNNETYIMKLTSTLSHSMYEYSLPEIHFTANVPNKHFTFSFEPQRKAVDQDTTHGSVMIFPVTLLILFLGYNYQKLLPLVSKYASSFYNQASSFQSSSQPRKVSNDNNSDLSLFPAELLGTDGIKKKAKAKKI